jgi:hypothetical protein
MDGGGGILGLGPTIGGGMPGLLVPPEGLEPSVLKG